MLRQTETLDRHEATVPYEQRRASFHHDSHVGHGPSIKVAGTGVRCGLIPTHYMWVRKDAQRLPTNFESHHRFYRFTTLLCNNTVICHSPVQKGIHHLMPIPNTTNCCGVHYLSILPKKPKPEDLVAVTAHSLR